MIESLVIGAAGLGLSALADLITGDPDPIVDPRAPEADAIAKQLATYNSMSGVNAANAAARGISSRAMTGYRDIANDPALRTNVGARVAAYNTLQTQAEGAISDAFVKGAAADEAAELQAHDRGAQLMDANRKAALQLATYNQQRAATPSPLEAILLQAGTTALGQGIASLTKPTTPTPKQQQQSPTQLPFPPPVDTSQFSIFAQPTKPPIYVPEPAAPSLLERIWRNGAGVPWQPLSPYVAN